MSKLIELGRVSSETKSKFRSLTQPDLSPDQKVCFVDFAPGQGTDGFYTTVRSDKQPTTYVVIEDSCD